MDHGLLPQLVGRPGHAPAVVSVGGGEEGGLAELPLQLLAGQVVIGHLRHVAAHLMGDIPGHGKGAAQHLEGVEAEAEGFVLDEQAAQAQILGHAVQPGQRRNGILGEAGVEITGFGYLVERHDGEVLVLAGRHMVVDPFDLFFHIQSPAHKFF